MADGKSFIRKAERSGSEKRTGKRSGACRDSSYLGMMRRCSGEERGGFLLQEAGGLTALCFHQERPNIF
uniref:Uncharacterized protein n=1 Tax=Paracidobacterium acidisoli TaxID=2303751 RepID=A0A372IK00_9BACT